MAEGLYSYRGKIYYGKYDEQQAKGKISMMRVKSENIMTDCPIKEDDWAVCFCDNHALLQPEYDDLRICIDVALKLEGRGGLVDLDFSQKEENLKISFPLVLKCIYSAISGQADYFEGAEHFIPLEDLYIDQGKIVFYKKKRTPIAGYDIQSGRLARYYKKEWAVDNGDFCVFKFCLSRILTNILERKAVVQKGRLNGKLVTTLNIQRELQKKELGQYKVLSELNLYGIAVIYSEDGVIAWIRSNGMYGDIRIGANNESQIDEIVKFLGDVSIQ